MAGEERTQTVMAVPTDDLRASFAPLGEFEAFGATVEGFGGQMVRSEEGWTVAIFRSATAALDAAASVQILAARTVPGVRSRPSMALDLGDLRNSGVGWVGAAINNAVRLAECAASGQVLVSRAVAVLSGSTEHRYTVINPTIADTFDVPATSEFLDWQRIDALSPLIPRREIVTERETTFGRAEALASLRDAVGRAAVVGDGAEVLVIEGAAGSGKSRLLDEAVRSSLAERATAILGRCRGRTVRRFDAIVDAVSPLIEAASHPHLQLWARGKPGLHSLFPQLAERNVLVGESRGEALTSDEGVAEVVAQFLLEAARDTRLVLLLDDAQLLDEWSLHVLDLLAAAPVNARPVLVLAADSDTRSPGWSSFLGRIANRPASNLIELAPLGRSDLTRLAGSLGYDLSVSDVADLQKVSGGVVGDAVQALQEEQVDRHVSGNDPAVERRLSDVSAEARRVAEAAALCGDRFETDIVALATGFRDEHLEACLTELEMRSMIRPADGSSATERRFAHSGVRNAIESATNGVRLVSLHQKLADAYAKRSRPDDLYELAVHLDAARPVATIEVVAEAWISASEKSLDRGNAAMSRHAAERGLQALTGAADRQLEARLWLLVAQAAVVGAAYDDATDAAASAAEASAAAGDLKTFCEAAAVRIPRRYGADNATMVELADRATSRFTDDLSPTLRSRVMVARARHERGNRSDELTRRALDLARSGQSVSALADALTERLFSIAGWPEAQGEARLLAEELLTIPLADLSIARRCEVLDAAALVKLECGDRLEFEHLLARLEHEVGRSPSNAAAILLDRRKALRSLLDGDWAAAMAHSSGSEVRVTHDYEADTVAAQVLWASLGEGDLDRFEIEVRRVRGLGFDGDAERAADATIAFCNGHIVETRSILDELLPIDPTGPGADCFSRSTVLALLGRIASACGSESHVRMLLESMQPRSGTVLALPGVVVYGPADRWLGTLHSRLGHFNEALDALDAALTLARTLGSAPAEARTLASLSTLYRLVGEEALAIRATSEAWEIADELGMKQLLSQLEVMYNGGPHGERWVAE